MNDKLSADETAKVLTALDEAVDNGPWDKSLFLRAIGKKLADLREEFKSGIEVDESVLVASHLASRVALRSGQQEVFVSIYNTNGSDILQWERIVATLATQSISRPTYSSEKDVREMIRSKGKKENEAYVTVYLNQRDIILPPANKQPRDKLGIALLTLREKCIKTDNIVRFFHKSGQYLFEQGRLVRQGDIDYADFN